MKTSKASFDSKNEIVAAINYSSSFNNKLSIIFIVFQTILLGSILSTTDVDILLSVKPFSKISFSGFDVQIPFMVVYVLFPVALLLIHFFLLLNFTMHFRKISCNSTNVNNLYPFFLNFFNSHYLNSTKKTFYGLIAYFLFFWLPLFVFLLILIIISKYQSNWLFLFHIVFLLADFIIVVFYTKALSGNLKFKSFYWLFHYAILLVALLHFTVYIILVNEKFPVNYAHNRFYSFALPVLTIENEVISRKFPNEKVMGDNQVLFSSGYQNLKNRSFKYSNFKNLSFYKADFRNSDFSNSQMSEMVFDECILQAANFRLATCLHSGFIKSDLKGVNFSGSKINGSKFTDVVLENAIFIASDATWVDFFYSDLKHADFTGSALDHSSFKGVNLFRTKFYAADFYQGDLSFTDLRYTLFQGANLMEVNFDGSIFVDLNFQNMGVNCRNMYKLYIDKGYSFFNLRGAMMPRAKGKILMVKNPDEKCIFYNEKIYYPDTTKFAHFVDSLNKLLSSDIVSIDTISGAVRPSLAENFKKRMLASKLRYDTASDEEYRLSPSIAIITSDSIKPYLELLKKQGVESPNIVTSLINNYSEVAKDSIYLRFKAIEY